MKNAIKPSALFSIPVLVHEETASLPWWSAMINQFHMYTKSHGIDITFFYHWQDVLSLNQGGFLIVMGVDMEWLQKIIFHLSSLQLHIILIAGKPNSTYNKISHILFDQKVVVEYSLNLLKNHGRYHTAFIGPQKNDTSDAIKAETFALSASPSDIYPISDSLDASFNCFFNNVEHYDSVICANDLLSVHLMKRCRQCNISIPKQLYVIGNSNLWISSHISPSLTTCAYDLNSLVAVTVRICENFFEFPDSSDMDIIIKPTMIERESTGASFRMDNSPANFLISNKFKDTTFDPGKLIQYPELQNIHTMNSKFSYCSPEDHLILQGLCNGHSYEQIADFLIMPLDTVKNRIKKLYRYLNIHTRQELIDIAAEYQIRFASYET